MNVNIGELKRGKGEEKKKKKERWGKKKGSIVTRLILLLVTRFSLRSFALTIFVFHCRVSCLEQIDIWIPSAHPKD